MPVYHYDCDECGEFSNVRKISACKLPATCPSCGQMAPRIIKAPSLNTMENTQRIAHQHNERSAHEPRLVRKDEKESHSGPKRSNVRHKHGPSRPWMLGH